MIDTFHFFSYFSGLKPNLTEFRVLKFRVLKGVQVAVCSMRFIDLNIDTLKKSFLNVVKSNNENINVMAF